MASNIMAPVVRVRMTAAAVALDIPLARAELTEPKAVVLRVGMEVEAPVEARQIIVRIMAAAVVDMLPAGVPEAERATIVVSRTEIKCSFRWLVGLAEE